MYRSIEKQNIFSVLFNYFLIFLIPIFGFIYPINELELWKILMIYLPISLFGWYMLGAKGVIVDLTNNRYKIFKKFFVWDIGIWENLPKIDRIVLKGTNNFIDTTPSESQSWTKTGYTEMNYKITLINHNLDFKLIIVNTKVKDEAYQLGKSISIDLNIHLEVFNL